MTHHDFNKTIMILNMHVVFVKITLTHCDFVNLTSHSNMHRDMLWRPASTREIMGPMFQDHKRGKRRISIQNFKVLDIRVTSLIYPTFYLFKNDVRLNHSHLKLDKTSMLHWPSPPKILSFLNISLVSYFQGYSSW